MVGNINLTAVSLCLQEAGILRYELHLMLTLGNEALRLMNPELLKLRDFRKRVEANIIFVTYYIC